MKITDKYKDLSPLWVKGYDQGYADGQIKGWHDCSIFSGFVGMFILLVCCFIVVRMKGGK